MNIISKLILSGSICAATIGCDQATKTIASEQLPRGENWSLLFDMIRIGYTENHGAFLSMGGNFSPELRYWLLVVGVGIFLGGLLIYLLLNKTLSAPAVAGFSFILSGGLSNFYDRLVNNGAVVDFLNLGVGPLRTGVFNVADVAIVIGVLLIFFYRSNSSPSKEAENAALDK